MKARYWTNGAAFWKLDENQKMWYRGFSDILWSESSLTQNDKRLKKLTVASEEEAEP